MRQLLIFYSLNMFRAPLCPSSGVQTWKLPVLCGAGCCMCVLLGRCGHIFRAVHTSNSQHYTTQATSSFVLLMMGILVPETCRVNKISILSHLVGFYFT